MKTQIVVTLDNSPDLPGMLEVVEIKQGHDKMESCDLMGIPDITHLEIGSLLKKEELYSVVGIRRFNKHIKFV